ncbi:hypothetical protein [Anaerolentibacter hominis]|uniref:hypothetical protein n=1 Tax=Anaerolentibacter hominis TaxID=3079009 RepID=UPI0031B89B1E
MRKKQPGVSVGTSSILVVFTLLCLITFAALSLVSANADYRLSAQLADRTSAYYEASNQAEKLLASMDDVLEECYENASSQEEYLQLAMERLTDQNRQFSMTGDNMCSFEVMINETQNLFVTALILYPESDGGCLYRVNRWVAGQSQTWEPDDKMNLLHAD